MPGTPSTFAISCGSAATAVVPCGSTVRTNSSIHSFVDSRCMWASTNAGVSARPPTSTISSASRSPQPATTPSAIASAVSTHSRVAGLNTRPPVISRSAGSSPRATAIARAVACGRAIGAGATRRTERAGRAIRVVRFVSTSTANWIRPPPFGGILTSVMPNGLIGRVVDPRAREGRADPPDARADPDTARTRAAAHDDGPGAAAACSSRSRRCRCSGASRRAERAFGPGELAAPAQAARSGPCWRSCGGGHAELDPRPPRRA